MAWNMGDLNELDYAEKRTTTYRLEAGCKRRISVEIVEVVASQVSLRAGKLWSLPWLCLYLWLYLQA